MNPSINCRLAEMRSSFSGSSPSELASEVAVPKREEAVGAIEIAIIGLMSGISGVNSVTEWLNSSNSMETDTGDKTGMDFDEEEPIGEAIRWLVVSTSPSYHGDDEISTVRELSEGSTD